jgi:hypothetical protein
MSRGTPTRVSSPCRLSTARVRVPTAAAVWSNKGSSAREKLSIWSADVEAGTLDWKRGARRVLALGHIAVGSHDAPSVKHLRVLEVTDTAAPTLSGSEHLQAVVEQASPPTERESLSFATVHSL